MSKRRKAGDVPPMIDSENVVYSHSFATGEGCSVCGRERCVVFAVRHACHRGHHRTAWQIRRGVKYPDRRLIEGPDVCRVCGTWTPPRRRVLHICGRSECVDVVDSRGWRFFTDAVKQPHPLTWLGPKLGLTRDDPRLAEIALALARNGKLVVYVRRDGSVGEVGRPREDAS